MVEHFLDPDLQTGLPVTCLYESENFYPLKVLEDAIVWATGIFLFQEDIGDSWELSADLPEGFAEDRRGRRIFDLTDQRFNHLTTYFSSVLTELESLAPFDIYSAIADSAPPIRKKDYRRYWSPSFLGWHVGHLASYGALEVCQKQSSDAVLYYCGILRDHSLP